jgi:predicted metal-dependent phosphoesterase TrpH
MKIQNPYGRDGVWLKGNLHTHTEASPCGHYPLEEIAATYGDRIMKYDFLAITDHLLMTDVSAVEGINGMVVFRGVEFKKEGSSC